MVGRSRGIQRETSRSRAALLLFFTASALYLFTSSGYIALSDADSMLAVTRSLLTQHQVYVDPSVGVPGVGHRSYSMYGIVWSLAVLPFYAVGTVLEPHLRGTGHGGPPMFFAS